MVTKLSGNHYGAPYIHDPTKAQDMRYELHTRPLLVDGIM